MKKIIVFVTLLTALSCTNKLTQNKEGKVILPLQKQGSYSYVDETGSSVFSGDYIFAGPFYNGYAVVKTIKGYYGIINLKGEIKILENVSRIRNFSEGFAAILVGKLWGYINVSGKIVIRPQFVEADDFSNGMAVVRSIGEGDTSSKYVYINNKNEILIHEFYDEAFPFFEGIALVVHAGKTFYINNRGEVLTSSLDIENGMFFSEGLAAISVKTKNGIVWGFINRSGDWIINPTYTSANSFSDGFAVVQKENKWILINRYGDLIRGIDAEKAYSPHDKIVRFVKNGFYGYMHTNGDILHEAVFEWGNDFQNGVAVLEKEVQSSGSSYQVSGYLFLDGHVIWGD